MTTIRNKTNISKEKVTNNPLLHIGYSASATIIAQPFRVLMNRASLYQSPMATIKDAYPYLIKGIGINFIRGSLSTGFQSYVKQSVQEQAGLMMSIIAAACCGTLVATFVETPFIRKTITQDQQINASLWRFNKSLITLYFLREVGFSLAVLAKQDLSPTVQQGVLIGATWTTATLHKFVTLEATRDKLSPDKTIPNFQKGLLTTIRCMAQGNIYTHPAFAVPFNDPKNYWTKIGNFLHVSCGANMFLFRLLYLITFREAYHLAMHTTSSINNSPRFFKKPLNETLPLQLTSSKAEKDHHSPKNNR